MADLDIDLSDAVSSAEYLGTTYGKFYVDATDGNDAKSGASATNAWKTIAHVNGITFKPGDYIYFQKGETWREQLTVPSSGSSGHPITFGTYGSGADPIINGSDVITGWTEVPVSDYGSDTLPDSWSIQDYIYYMQISVTTGGQIQSYDIYMYDINCTHAKCALYTDNLDTPDALVSNSESVELTSFTASDWNNFNVSGGATIGSGTYWVAVWMDGGNTRHTKYIPGDELRGSESLEYGSWPSSANSAGEATEGVGFKVNVGPQNQWQATCSTEPLHIYLDTTRGNPQASQIAVDSTNDWYWNSNVLYVYATSDPDTAYTSPGIEAQARDYCIFGTSKNYITVQNLHIKYANKRGICQDGGQNWTADSNTAEYCGPHNATNGGGIYFDGTNIIMTNNTVSRCAGPGLYCLNDTSGATISGNTSFNNDGKVTSEGYDDAIILDTCTNPTCSNNTFYTSTTKPLVLASLGTGGTFENNYCYDGKFGMSISQSNAIVRYNKIKNCGGGSQGGIKFSGSITGIECYYNLLINCNQGFYIDNTTANIYNNSVYGDSQGRAFRAVSLSGNVKNNIFYATNYTQHVMLNNTPGSLTMNNNVFYPEGTSFISYGGSNYDTLAAYQSGSGQDANSSKDEPLFIGATDDNLKLKKSSPCLYAGIDVGLTQDYLGNTVPSGGTVDIGAYEYGSIWSTMNESVSVSIS